MMNSQNLMLQSNAYKQNTMRSGGESMSINATVAKTSVLVGITTAVAAVSYSLSQESVGMYWGFTLGGLAMAAISLMVAGFKPQLSAWTALPVSLGMGGFAGGSSMAVTSFLPPAKEGDMLASPEAAIFSALILTLSIAGGLLAGYATGMIRPNKLFRNIIITGMWGVALFALVAMGSMFFGNGTIASVFRPDNGGIAAIGLSLVITVLAAGMLVIDFEEVHNGARNHAPKYMEWYGAQSILFSLVYLYVQVLRLLVKLANRD